MHLVAGNFIDLTTEKLLVPALPQLAVLAMIEVVGIQEDKVHVVGIGSKEVLALVIDHLESNPQFLEHRASSSRIVRVHVHCYEVDIDRKSVLWGKSVSLSVDLGGSGIINKKKNKN